MTASLAVEIFDNIHELLHLFRTHVQTRMEAIQPELTLNGMRVLVHAGSRPGMAQKDMIDRSHKDKAQMGRILVYLEEKGWLERTASESDKRVRCLYLSEQGRQLYFQLRDLQDQVASDLLKECPKTV